MHRYGERRPKDRENFWLKFPCLAIKYKFYSIIGLENTGSRTNQSDVMGGYREETYIAGQEYLYIHIFYYHNKLWKVLKQMGISDHFTCLLRNLYAGQEATVRTLYGTTDWFRIEKGVRQDCLLSPCLFKLYAKHIIRNDRLGEL